MSVVTLQDGTSATVTASSQFNSNFPVKNLFDPDYTDYNKDWASDKNRLPNNQPEWVTLQFNEPRRITGYTLITSTFPSSINPAAWVLKGSTNGSTWITLDTHTKETTGYFNTQDQVTKAFSVNSIALYSFIRLEISEIFEWQWWDEKLHQNRVDLAGWELTLSPATNPPMTTSPPWTTIPPTIAPNPPPQGPVDVTLQDNETQATLTWSSHSQQQYAATNLLVAYGDFYKDWITKSTQPAMDEEWVQMEFQQPRRVTSYTLVTSAYGNSYNPAQWALRGSNDGTQWTTIHDQFPSQTQDFNQQAQTSKSFQITSPTTYRFIRLVISKSWITWENRIGGSRVSLAGFDLQTTDSTVTTAPPLTTIPPTIAPTPPPQGPVDVILQDGTSATMFVSSSHKSFSPENMFDDSNYTNSNLDWVSDDKRFRNAMTEWVALQFAAPRRVTGYTLITSTHGQSQNPAAWMLEGSMNGLSWTNLHSQTTTDSGDLKNQSQVTKTFQIQSTDMYTFVRLVISKSWDDITGTPEGFRVDLAGFNLETTDNPPATTIPPTNPPATTIPPTNPPATTIPPTNPPATTIPPTNPFRLIGEPVGHTGPIFLRILILFGRVKEIRRLELRRSVHPM
jgi:hypothetical protein